MKKLILLLLFPLSLFGQGKISEMPAASTVTGTELMEVVQGGVNKKITLSQTGSTFYVPLARTLTINGTAYDLNANRSWSVGNVFTSGTYSNPSWITSFAATKITGTLLETQGGTGFNSYTVGDLLYASAPTTLQKLGIGTNGYALISNGTTPSWQPISTTLAGLSDVSLTGLASGDFLKYNGSAWINRTSAQVLSDIGAQATGQSWLLGSGGTLTGDNIITQGSWKVGFTGQVGIGTSSVTSSTALTIERGSGFTYQNIVDMRSAGISVWNLTGSARVTHSNTSQLTIGTNAAYTENGAWSASSGTATNVAFDIKNSLNFTGSYIGSAIGFRYDPTRTSTIGLTEYAFISSGGLHGFGTLTPTAKVHIKGDGTTTGSTFKIDDSSGTNRFLMLDNGKAVFGSGSVAPSNSTTLSLTRGTGVLNNLLEGFNGNDLSSTSIFLLERTGKLTIRPVWAGSAGNSGLVFTPSYSAYPSAGNDNHLVVNPTHAPSSGTFNQSMINASPILNTTGTYVGSVIGFQYNPTRTSTTGLTEYAFISSGGLHGLGTLTPTTTTRADIIGISSGSILRLANNSNSEKWNFQNDGSLLIGGSAGTPGQVITSAGTGAPPTWSTPSSGITNSAANNELMKSDGTNAVSSGILSSTAGNVTLGLTSTTGATRTITSEGTSSDVGITIQPKGSGSQLHFVSASGASEIYVQNSLNYFNTTGAAYNAFESAQYNYVGYTGSSTSMVYPLRIANTTSGAPANNSTGTGIAFYTRTSISGINDELGSTIESLMTDKTSTSEDFDLVFKTMSGGAAAAERIRITSDGRLYGTSLHNNSGSVTGTTNQYIASGTYTPTLTNVANVDSNTPLTSQWIRVGNVVTVSGLLAVDPTSTTTTTQIDISLPIASDFVNIEECAGVANFIENNSSGAIYAETTNNRAVLQFTSFGTSSTNSYYTFTYTIK